MKLLVRKIFIDELMMSVKSEHSYWRPQDTLKSPNDSEKADDTSR